MAGNWSRRRAEDGRRELDDALKDYENLRTEYNDLVRQWSRYIEMVGPRRPLRASDAQIAEVRKRREAAASRGRSPPRPI